MLKEYISQKNLVQTVLTIEELEANSKSKDSLNIMMGLTFDDGQPVDMMKYSLFMMTLTDILESKGVQVRSNWLIADHFIVDINKDADAKKAKIQVSARINYLQKLNDVYGGNIGFVLSSELSKSEVYQDNLAKLFFEADKNSQFKELVLQAVPEDRRDNPHALRYPFEELATIQSMNADIKIGPPYEKFYDEPARDYSPIVGFNKFVGIHLTRAFPFGNPTLSEKLKSGIEKFGILPYKIGSKGLNDYRIDPVNDNLEKVKKLIRATTDVRALVDLQTISKLAKQRLNGTDYSSACTCKCANQCNAATKQLENLKNRVIESYTEVIYYQLNN